MPPHAEPPRTSPPEKQATASSAIVELRDVHKRFGQQVVLDGVNVAIERGKTTVILGPSGCGKSVLLKCIVGLLRPDRGQVFFNTQRVDTLSESKYATVRRHIGFVFQLSALFDSMDIFENLAFPFREHTRLKEPEIRRRVVRALRLVDLRGIEQKLPSQLSGGQQKRVAVARAVIQKPELVLYDEPTTGLDPVRAAGINSLIKKLKQELGVTSIVVTHDLESARAIGDRVLLLIGGRFIADGTFAEVADSDDPKVRSFFSTTAEQIDEIEAAQRDPATQPHEPIAESVSVTDDAETPPPPLSSTDA